MPAAAPEARRLRVDVSKNFSTAASSQEGAFVTSTTAEAPFSAPASPSLVMLLTPELGAAATASCPCPPSNLTSLDPMSPVPPITTIFMVGLSPFHRCHSKQVVSPAETVRPMVCGNPDHSPRLPIPNPQSPTPGPIHTVSFYDSKRLSPPTRTSPCYCAS